MTLKPSGRPKLTSSQLFSGNDKLDTKRMKILMELEDINQKYICDVTGMAKNEVSNFVHRKRVFKKLILFFEHLATKHYEYFSRIKE